MPAASNRKPRNIELLNRCGVSGCWFPKVVLGARRARCNGAGCNGSPFEWVPYSRAIRQTDFKLIE